MVLTLMKLIVPRGKEIISDLSNMVWGVAGQEYTCEGLSEHVEGTKDSQRK
jgi:hypothetical protein